jgi:LPS sulfotransferase NodH
MFNEPIVLDPEWQEWLEESAQQESRSTSELVNEALQYYFHARQREKLAQEVSAYEAMHAELWRTMPGKWVAVHQQTVVDTDIDDVALYRRIRANYPHTAVLIRQVRAKPVEEIGWRHFRLENHSK